MTETLIELARQFGPTLAILLVGIWALSTGLVVPRAQADAWKILYERERGLREKEIDERQRQIEEYRRAIEDLRRENSRP